MTPTVEQSLIVTRALARERNLLVNARAGAAKTTTIELMGDAVQAPSRAISFNKKIADELKRRLPSHVESSTMNSLCHRAFGRYLGKFLKVNTDKNYNLIKEVIEAGDFPQAEKKELYENFNEMKKALAQSKHAGFLPYKHSVAKPLITDPDVFYAGLDENFSSLEQEVINEAVIRNFKAAMLGEIDFDDQILMAGIMPVPFEKLPMTYVDEAQDLSTINHHILNKMVRDQRLIAVGDPCQAIYEFRGAHADSMAEMKTRFDMEELYLTMCFRSAELIIKEAQWRAPDMMWRPGAPQGIVKPLNGWTPSDLKDGDAIVCRNNAPLFRMAIALLRERMFPQLASGDLIRGLKTMMNKLGKPMTPSAEAIFKLPILAEARKKRLKDPSKADDQIECIRVFLEEADTLGGAISLLDDISQRSGRIQLMTGHKSKGLEFDRVFIMDQHLLKPFGQDLNLKYVMQTRAKQELYYVNSESWGMPHMEAEE